MATLTTSYQLIGNKYIGDASSSTTKNVYLRIYAKYTSQDIAGNKSNVAYKSTLYVDGGGTYFYTGNYTTKSLSGTGANSTSGDAQGNYYIGETTLCEITGTVAHNSAGEASVSITAGWVSTPWGINGSHTVSATLPTIARATTPTLSATSVTMGGNVTITLKPANSSFKHKLRYDFVNSKGQADGMSIGWDFSAAGNTTATFTPPVSLSEQIPNANSGTCSVICYTYLSDGTHIGTKTVNLTLSVPSYTPVIEAIALAGNNLLSSTYVEGKSTVTATITASTSYYASISAISSVVDGKTYSGATFTSDVLSSGSKTIVTTITDSRGKTATLTSSDFMVYDYEMPQITDFSLARQSNGTTVIATVKGSIAAVNNKNTKTIKVTLNGVTNTITTSGYTINATTTFTNVNTDTTFTATATFTDYYNTVSKDSVLPTVAVTLDFYKDGKGIAMGKVAEYSNLLEVEWDAKLNGNLTVTGDLRVQGETLAVNWSTINVIYPVGSIYMSVSSTSPAVLFGGGTWEQLKNRFLIGCGDSYSAGATGGSATHTLSVAEMPTHGNHLYGSGDWIGQGASGGKYLNTDANMSSYGSSGRGWNLSSNEAYPAGYTTGGGQAHNNMPPYLAVYMWKRTA